MQTFVPFQEVSQEVYSKKYQLKDKYGNPIDEDMDATFRRVASALANVEKPEKRDEWYEQFLWAMRNGAIPAGRILSNAGAEQYKPRTSTINCVVQGIKDSIEGIGQSVMDSMISLSAGCGVGYCFSSLRPKGAYVAGVGASTSGPLPFAEIFDRACFTISSAGGRRGAQMLTFDCRHPDVQEFIHAKREHGRLRQFNISILVSNKFMEAVEKDEDWHLIFPIREGEIVTGQTMWSDWLFDDDAYTKNENGELLCKIYKTIKAKDLWDEIIASTYDYAEPGVIFIDRINNENNGWAWETLSATNPCGEQALPDQGACDLGSVNLAHMVKFPFHQKAFFDWEKFEKVTKIFTRMLDNVCDISGLPLEKQREEILRKRRHGMGVTGLGTAMQMLRMKYGSKESCQFTDQVCYRLALHNYQVGIELAKEKGPAPIMEEDFELTPELCAKRNIDNWPTDRTYKGKELWILSPFLQRLFHRAMEEGEKLGDFSTYGCRFTHATSIAPTGTISLSIGNCVSAGIEPDFSLEYYRNVIVEGKKSKQKSVVRSFGFLAYRELVDKNVEVNRLPDYFVTANDIGVKEHVDVQAAAQRWLDSSCSKTTNCPTEMSFEEFKDVYRYGYEKGLKGLTTYRYSDKAVGAVLITQENLEKDRYKFKLEDGSELVVRGDEEVEYEGEVHNARNLYEAIREGYYGKLG